MKSPTQETKSATADASGNLSTINNSLPQEWLRVKEACSYSRLSKPKLYDLFNRGLVKTVSLKERGQVKGSRLVSFDSLKAFLESRSTGGEANIATKPVDEAGPRANAPIVQPFA
jgi:hypothetical protein